MLILCQYRVALRYDVQLAVQLAVEKAKGCNNKETDRSTFTYYITPPLHLTLNVPTPLFRDKAQPQASHSMDFITKSSNSKALFQYLRSPSWLATIFR